MYSPSRASGTFGAFFCLTGFAFGCSSARRCFSFFLRFSFTFCFCGFQGLI
ncbi:putative membrane protein [Escherichia coli 5-172-05_S4_C3]|nr:putative membrane protein [Escherichia coli 5-172-05_S4_C2]KEL41562.1 putative membrane protein [Escherichia coli 5-172-05_S4_C1]KEL64271.1 putative membrane protein [Escherichia coli 5-172-05_S4_C3]